MQVQKNKTKKPPKNPINSLSLPKPPALCTSLQEIEKKGKQIKQGHEGVISESKLGETLGQRGLVPSITTTTTQ